MSTLDQIATKIIKEQELIVGPLAWREAGEVKGVHVEDRNSVSIDNENGMGIIDDLVGRYENLFGKTSIEVCKSAVASLLGDLSPAEIPSKLK